MEIVWSESFFKRRTITINFSLYSLCLYLFNCLNFICWFNRFEYVFFVLFFWLLLHSLAVKISLPSYDFLSIIIVLIQVYNWQIRHHSLVFCCGLADIFYNFTKMPRRTISSRLKSQKHPPKKFQTERTAQQLPLSHHTLSYGKEN